MRIILQLLVIFLLAGKFSYSGGIIIAVITVITNLLYFLIIYRLNPGSLNWSIDTGGIDNNYESKTHIVWFVLMILTLAVSSLDGGRMKWSNLDYSIRYTAAFVLIVSNIMLLYSVYLRITTDLRERNISEEFLIINKGPFRYLRYPDYSAIMFSSVATPLVMGSVWGLAFASGIVILYIIKTDMEDVYYTENQKSYRRYRKVVKYRIFPYIW
jgi:protein-S-isoprenylcysteine O-methyltransferase Ste14